MAFGITLKECLSSSNSSVRNFSEVTGINRGWIYNIFNGKKTLSLNKFQKMISSYPFTEKQKNLLIESYYSDMYGANNFKKIQYIISSLNSFSSDNLVDSYSDAFDVKNYKKNTCLENTDSILQGIAFILKEVSLDNPYIYTNFSFEQDSVNNIIYSFLVNNRNIDFHHIINFDTVDVGTHNLNNIFAAIKYASLGYTTYYHYNNYTMPVQLDNLFPFFVASDNEILVYDVNLSNGFILTDKAIVKSFIDKIKTLFIKATPLVHFDDNVLNSNIDSFCNKPTYNISYYPNMPFSNDLVLSSTIFENNTTNNIYNWFEKIISISQSVFLLHIDGFEKFFNNKILTSNIKELTTNKKTLFFDKFIRHYSDKKNIYFIDDSIFSVPKDFSISTNSSSFLLYVKCNEDSTTDEKLHNKYYIYLDNPFIVKDFELFIKYIIENKYYFNNTHISQIFNYLKDYINSKDSSN